MPTKTQPKRKVTLTLTPETLQVLDAEAQAQGSSRSATLTRLLNERQDRDAPGGKEAEELEAATAAYYTNRNETDQAEDDDWAAFAGQAAAHAWPRT
ncbi:MAG: hypothetical protein M3Y28_02590 [Armatimonadota bacterium]|nr:hypothetical protein [Armatimonadota bacterium]